MPLSISLLLIMPLSSGSQDLPSDSTIAEEEGALLKQLERAAENDPQLIAAFKDYHSALQKVPQVGALPDPELALGYFISPVETRVGPQRANFSVSQMFPWFGTLEKKEEAAALKAKAAYAEFRSQRAELYQKVRNTWYELAFKQARIRSVDSTLRTLRTMERISDSRYQTGQRSMADHLRIRMERREMEEKLQSIKDELSPLRTRFNSLTGRSHDAELQFPEGFTELQLPYEDRQQLRDSVIKADPVLDKLEWQERSQKKEKAVAQAEGKPSFGVGLNYTVVGKRPGADISDNGKDVLIPMLRMKLPIYRDRYKAAVKEAEYRAESYRRSMQDRKETLHADIEEAYTAYDDALRRLELYEAQLQDAIRARNILLDAFRTGDADVEELLELQRKVYRYRTERDRARKDRNKAVARIKKMLTV